MKILFKKLLMVTYFIAGALILEAVAFSVLDFGFMPDYFLYDLSLILIIAFLIYIIPNYTAQYVIFTIILLLQSILIYVNYSLYSIYGDLFSIEMLSLLGEATAAINSNFIYIGTILQLFAVFLAITIVGAIILKYCRKDKINFKEHYSIFCVLILVFIQCFSISYYVNTWSSINNSNKITENQNIVDDNLLMNTLFIKSASYKKFGTYGYIANMILSGTTSVKDILVEKTVDYMNSGIRYTADTSEVFGVDEGNNVIVIMMESLEWFGFGDGTYDKNIENLSSELTPNIYSLIYGEDYKIDLNNTNKSNDSVVAKNFYSKSKTNFSEAQGILGIYPVGKNLTNIAGKNYDKSSNGLGYSLPNVLKSKGYTTSYVHSNIITFYDRDQTHGNLGFDNVIGKDNLLDESGNPYYTGKELSWEHWAGEADFVRNAIDYIVPNPNENPNPFFTFYLNVSSHGSYEYNPNEVDCVRYYDYVIYGEDDCELVNVDGEYFYDANDNIITDVATLQDMYPNVNYVWRVNKSVPEDELTFTNWYQNVYDNYYDVFTDDKHTTRLSDELVYFQCGIMGLDEAIGVVKNKLKEYGIYDNTTLLLYSDHYSYYNNLSNNYKGLDRSDYSSMEVNRIPMILSSPGLKRDYAGEYITTTRFTTAYDIIPTILDLLGIEFNENLYLGSSIFAPAITDYVYTIDGEEREMLVYYSNTGGLFSLDIYSFNLSSFVYQNPNVDEDIKNLFIKKASNLLFKLNYITILNNLNLYHKLTNI